MDYLLNTIKIIYITLHHRDVTIAELISKFVKLSTSKPIELSVKDPITTLSLDFNIFINIERKVKWRKNTALAIINVTIHLNNSDEAIYRNINTLK